MDYPRYQPRHQRPKGAGAFFDWNVFVSGNGTAKLKSCRIDRRWNRTTSGLWAAEAGKARAAR